MSRTVSRNIAAPHQDNIISPLKRANNPLSPNNSKQSSEVDYVDFRTFQFQPLEPLDDLQFNQVKPLIALFTDY